MRARALVPFVAAAIAAGCASPPRADLGEARATEPFRREHVAIREHLGHAEAWATGLAAAPPAERAERMRKVAAFFRGHIVPHAGAEERALYPVVDRHAGSAAEHPFTASMRHEHEIVARWTAELEAEAAKPSPDAEAFSRRALELVGLVAAHFEAEEEVLLPVLDASMTAAEFREQVVDRSHAH